VYALTVVSVRVAHAAYLMQQLEEVNNKQLTINKIMRMIYVCTRLQIGLHGLQVAHRAVVLIQ
jgi:hypothetical protein